MATLNSNVPPGPLAQKWEKHKFSTKLINPANKRKYRVIVVGGGLAGASAFQSLGLDHPRYTRRITAVGIAFALLIGLGLALIPVWVYFTH